MGGLNLKRIKRVSLELQLAFGVYAMNNLGNGSSFSNWVDANYDPVNDIPIFSTVNMWRILPSSIKKVSLSDLITEWDSNFDNDEFFDPDTIKDFIDYADDNMVLSMDDNMITSKAKSFRFLRPNPVLYHATKQKEWVSESYDLDQDLKIISMNIHKHRC